MSTGRSRFLTLLTVAGIGIAFAGCGDAGDEGAGAQQAGGLESVPGPATTATATDPTTVASTGTTPPTASLPTTDTDECPSDRKTLEVAIEAYYAVNGTYPSDQAELVAAEMLRVEFETYDIEPESGDVVRVHDVPCPTPVVDDDPPMTADDLYALFEEEDMVDTLGGPDCARELAELGASFSRFEAREGREPESMEELGPDLAIEPVLWVLDFDGERIDPALGSPCPDISQFFTEEPSDECNPARKTLEVAREAYFVMLGPDVPEPDEADLVAEGLIRNETDLYDLVDGEVVPVAGGPCE